ncbi:hypothetical protein B1M_42028 [Burkholderia sp. TJI49]|nr:hypothetical protein B1M_42028 [Burkholderia sp. TJI49]
MKSWNPVPDWPSCRASEHGAAGAADARERVSAAVPLRHRPRC